jgi:hypothetical protein
MRKAGVINCRMKAKDRDGWWRILQKATAYLGALCYSCCDDNLLKYRCSYVVTVESK